MNRTTVRRTRGILLTAIMVFSVVATGVAFTGTAAAVEVNQCTTISEPGTYTLTQNIEVDSADSSCIVITSSDVVFDGNGNAIIDTSGDDDSNSGDAAAIVADAGGTAISDITVTDTVVQDFDDGIRFEVVVTGEISDNTATQNAEGIEVSSSNRIEITDNTLENNMVDGGSGGAGISLYTVVNSRVVNNDLTGNNLGIYLTGASENEIVDNDVDGTTAASGIGLFSESTSNTIENNTVTNAGGNGIVLASGSDDNTVVNNTASNSGDDGLNLNDASNNEIRNNVFANNGRSGITLNEDDFGDGNQAPESGAEDGSNDNILTDNVITENTVNGIGLAGNNADNQIYDNLLNNSNNVGFAGGAASTPNEYNVEPTAETNVIGGDTTAGNYYAQPGDTQGYSEMCADNEAEFGICDESLDLDGDESTTADVDNFPLTVEIGELQITPDPVEFGEIEADESETRTITFENVGDDTISVDPEDSLDDDSDDNSFTIVSENTSERTLAPGESFELTVEFAPDDESNDQTASLDVTSNDSSEQNTGVLLTGDGAPAGMGDIDAPANAMFGDVTVGETKTQTVTLENEGTDPVTVDETSISGANVSEFEVIAGGAGDGTFTLAPDDTRDLTVRFAPDSTGDKDATLTVDTQEDGTETTQLSGTGQANILTITGADGTINYGFSVTGEVGESGDTVDQQFADDIDGQTASGVAGGGEDSYTFTGDLIRLEVSDQATVLLNGEEIDPGDYPDNILRVSGANGTTNYGFSASRAGVSEVAGSVDQQFADEIDGKTASGVAGGGEDIYGFNGDLVRLEVSDQATVILNGEEIDPGDYPDDVLRISGVDGTVSYEFAANSGVSEAYGVDQQFADSIEGTTASGVAGGGEDAYAFSGDLTRLAVSGQAEVILNGEEIDPGDYPDNIITISGVGETVSYEFTASGDVGENYGVEQQFADRIEGTTGSGVVGPGDDSYTFAGDLVSLNVDGEAVVTVNGEEAETA